MRGSKQGSCCLIFFFAKTLGSARRVADAQSHGQLLVFSPSHRGLPVHANTFCLDISPARNSNAADSSSVGSSNLTDSNNQNKQQEELLKKMSEDMANLAKNAEAAANSRTDQDELLQKVRELQESHLVTTNNELQREIRTMQDRHTTDVERFATEKTRLEMQLQQSEQTVQQLQTLQITVQEQLKAIQQEKDAVAASANALETELALVKAQSEQNKMMMENLRKEHARDTQTLELKTEQLQATNQNLDSVLGQVRDSNSELQAKLVSYQQLVDRLEKVTVPELESTLESERDTIARLEARVAELEDCQEMVTALQSQVTALQQQNESSQQTLVNVNHDHTAALVELEATINEKDEQIASLSQQMESQRQNLEMELEEMAKSNETLKLAKASLVVQQKQVNDALEESMQQLDVLENEKKDLEANLAKALKKLQHANELLEGKDSEAATIVEGLANQVSDERQRRQELETRCLEMERLARERETRTRELEKELKLSVQERDLARNNMQGYGSREDELYRKLRESDRIRREMHSRIMQLMGNIRVLVRVRPPLPGEDASLPHESVGGGDDDYDKKRKRDSIASTGKSPFSFPGVYESREKKHSADDLTKNILEVQEPKQDRGYVFVYISLYKIN
jgi:chromosome segregation ATPase